MAFLNIAKLIGLFVLVPGAVVALLVHRSDKSVPARPARSGSQLPLWWILMVTKFVATLFALGLYWLSKYRIPGWSDPPVSLRPVKRQMIAKAVRPVS